MSHQSSAFPIHILVNDDSRVHTELLANALKRDGELKVTTSTSGFEGLLRHLYDDRIDVLLMSSNFDEQSGRGFEVLRTLRSSNSEVPAVLLLDRSTNEAIVEAFRAGARGVFSRDESIDTLRKCLRRVYEGQIWANSQQLAVLIRELSRSHNVRAVDARGMSLLSKREMEIVLRVAQGLTNREIADSLGLSPHTVKNCLFRVFDKLGISNRVELLFMTLSRDRDVQSGFENLSNIQGGQKPLDEATLVSCHSAADQGGILAQLALAQFYSARRANPPDSMQAYKWYLIAREQISRDLSEMSKEMTMDQLRQAEKAAADWLKNTEKTSWKTPPKTSATRLTDTGRSDEHSRYD